MEKQNLTELLGQLQEVLDQTEGLDDETLEMVRRLDEDINRLLDADQEDDDSASLIDRAKSAETRFAVDHPVAERFLREIADALSRVGI